MKRKNLIKTSYLVKNAYKDGVSIQQLSKLSGKSLSSIRSCQRRNKIKLNSESVKSAWGSLKQKILKINTSIYTAKEVAKILNTSIYSVYSLCSRHNLNLKKADYGSQRDTSYSKYKKQINE